MNTRCKNILKACCFLLLLFGILSFFSRKMNYVDTGGGGGFERLERLPSNSADVIFFGSSHAHCTVDLGLLWDRYGIAGYTFSAGAQPMNATKDFVRYALSEQHPEVICVELFGIMRDGISLETVDVYRNLLGMRWSPAYVKTAVEMANQMDVSFDERFEMITKIPLIHDRYTELFEKKENLYPFLMGYRGSDEIAPLERPNVEEWNSENPVPTDILHEIDEIVEIAEKKGAKVLFWAAPYCLSQEEKERLNSFKTYAAEHELAYVDFNEMYDALGLDFSTDFRDKDHLNFDGSEKVTLELGRCLADEYNLVPHDDKEDYVLWDENSRYVADRKLQRDLKGCGTFDDYLKKLSEEGNHLLVGISLYGNYLALPDIYAEEASRMGISFEDYQNGGAFLLNENMVTEHLEADYQKKIETLYGDICLESSKPMFLIDGTEYSFPENSVGVFVYDLELGYLVDVAYLDIYYVGNQILHCEMETED